MKRFRTELILATLAALATGSAAIAQDAKYDVDNETGDGRTRGIDIRPIVPIPVPAPVVKPPQTRSEDKPPVKAPVAGTQPAGPPKAAASAKPNLSKQASPVQSRTAAVQPKKSGKVAVMPEVNITPVQPAQGQIVNVSHQVPVAASSTVVTASLDRPGNMPKYKVGDKLVVNIKANQDCNLVVFNYDSTGTLTQIFPNDYQQSGFIRSGDTVQIGGPESPFDYQVAGKGGAEKIFVYAYPTGSEAPLTVALNPLSGTPFRSAEVSPEQYRQMVNDSKVFFSREVKVVPKRVQNASSSGQPTPPNKVELTFVVEK